MLCPLSYRGVVRRLRFERRNRPFKRTRYASSRQRREQHGVLPEIRTRIPKGLSFRGLPITVRSMQLVSGERIERATVAV